MKPLIIIPTYNERENIEPLVNDVLGRYQAVEVLVVDDNSPDGTGDAVTKMKSQNPRVHLLSRPGKQGLGKAYLAGFKWGLDKGYDRFVEMDADFSHRPEDLGKLLEASQDRDVVIG
ncbi:MAG: glycosyltransferase, partial [Bdellovibrionales bacterium]|nr:glycosyltransferase [Bdellovibrionales bacterium]